MFLLHKVELRKLLTPTVVVAVIALSFQIEPYNTLCQAVKTK